MTVKSPPKQKKDLTGIQKHTLLHVTVRVAERVPCVRDCIFQGVVVACLIFLPGAR